MSREEMAAFRAKQRAAGRVQLTLWATPEQKAAIQAFAKGLPQPPSEPTLILGAGHGTIKLTPDSLRVVLTALRDHLTTQPVQQ